MTLPSFEKWFANSPAGVAYREAEQTALAVARREAAGAIKAADTEHAKQLPIATKAALAAKEKTAEAQRQLDAAINAERLVFADKHNLVWRHENNRQTLLRKLDIELVDPRIEAFKVQAREAHEAARKAGPATLVGQVFDGRLGGHRNTATSNGVAFGKRLSALVALIGDSTIEAIHTAPDVETAIAAAWAALPSADAWDDEEIAAKIKAGDSLLEKAQQLVGSVFNSQPRTELE